MNEHPITDSPTVPWVLTLVEPLIPDARRAAASQRLREWTVSVPPDISAVFFGGFLSDIVGTLPLEDPWRCLSARIGGLSYGDRPPSVDGATREDGEVFGTWEDATDLYPVVFDENLELDVAFTPLVEALSPAAAAAIAFADDGWDTCIEAFVRIAGQAPDGVSGGAMMFDAGVDAVRWALHRRRAYGGPEDSWPVESGWAWAWRVWRKGRGHDWMAVEGARQQALDRLAAHAVVPGIEEYES